jgi:AcrR family transcriptional regulator
VNVHALLAEANFMALEKTGTRGLINRTALKLFAEQGIRETTIRDIAGAAGIAEGTMYRHYASKDELAWKLFADNYAAIGRELDEIQRTETGTAAKIEVMVRYFLRAYDRDPDVFTYLFLARHRHMQKVNPRMPNAYFVFRRVIRDGIRKGAIPGQDPDVATSMTMGVILQVIDSRLLGGRIKQRISDLADTIVEACLRVLGT